MKETILKLKQEGKSIRQIAKIVGLSRTAVWCHCNPKKAASSQKKRARKHKLDFIKLRGSKCEICGYDKCLPALDFHHKDKAQKSFSISNGYRTSKKKEEIIEEIKKCVLLCSNCHHEVHEGLASVEGFEPIVSPE